MRIRGLDETTVAGNLLAVDDSVLEKRGGERYSVTLDGKAVALDALSSTSLTGGEELTVEDGADTYEEHDVARNHHRAYGDGEGYGRHPVCENLGRPGQV